MAQGLQPQQAWSPDPVDTLQAKDTGNKLFSEGATLGRSCPFFFLKTATDGLLVCQASWKKVKGRETFGGDVEHLTQISNVWFDSMAGMNIALHLLEQSYEHV